ncbi:MAG: rhomboid family intramembrane serine protease [Cyclobacteriaceae bacterium]|nr:rhomboid family intramembrane serine protease [Cyclobacteriaceae bacterium SS2]
MNNGFFDEFKNAWDKPNNALVQIIIINVVIFVVLLVLKVLLVVSEQGATYEVIRSKLMLPASIPYLLKQPWTVVTYFFTHEGFLHIIFNMLFLFWFGRIIQEFLGQNKVIALYVLGGLAGGLFYILIYNIIPFYQGRVEGSLMLGASAGVYAIVVGAATFMPNYTFFLLFLGPVKIKYIAIFYVLLSFSQSIGSNAGGELAHLAGAGVGFLYITQLNQGNDFGNWIIQFIKWIKSFFVSKPKIKVTHRNKAQQKAQSARTMNVEADQDEIDAILDKISQSGYESLSKDEKQKLFNASKK